MNVGFALLTMFPGRVGGSESYVRGLLDEYAKGNGPDHVTVLANRYVADAYPPTPGGAVEVHQVRSYRPGNRNVSRFAALQWSRAAPRLVAKDVPGDLDLIHYAVTIPVPRVVGVPRVMTLYDVQHHELPAMFSPLERRLRAWAYDDAARDADLVITISERSREAITHHLGVPKERVVAIPLGVDHARFTPDGPTAHAVPERYVFYPANFWPHKNHERLLEAFGRVRDPNLWLVLTGQTYGRESLLKGRERVVHLGHVTADRLAALYRGATGMVFPSLFEGFGLPVLEAMASGCPVAASNDGAVAEVAGQAAVTFDPTDVRAITTAIEGIAGDEGLRAHLKEAGLARASEFTWGATAQRHLAVYHQVLSASGAA
jgi:glycosyltransferase involved in cell wall biosynthesis